MPEGPRPGRIGVGEPATAGNRPGRRESLAPLRPRTGAIFCGVWPSPTTATRAVASVGGMVTHGGLFHPAAPRTPTELRGRRAHSVTIVRSPNHAPKSALGTSRTLDSTLKYSSGLNPNIPATRFDGNDSHLLR